MDKAQNIETGLVTQDDEAVTQSSFSVRHTLRISSFQIGSAAADIFTASVWNRVMIADLGMPATWVGLLLALQYFLLPLSFWAGHRSDRKLLWGRRRTSYIWVGRGLMVLSFPFLGMSIRLFEDGVPASGWLLAIFAFFLFGAGKLFSGSVYLALVRESAPASKQGVAIGLAETMLIGFFPIMAIVYGRWLPVYDPQTFATLILFTAVLCSIMWFFAIFKTEADVPLSLSRASRSGSFAETTDQFKRIWHDGRVRRFFAFLFMATFAAWMQDNILEPFGADVFKLEAGETTRFTGYWGAATIIVLVSCFIIFRRRLPETLSNVAKSGLGIMALGMVFFAISSFGFQERVLVMALLTFGIGFGLYSFGGLSLMAVMSPDIDAGAFLGLWTVCILVSKGLGTFAGGALRDLFYYGFDLTFTMTYGFIFVVSAVGLILAAFILSGRQIISFAVESGRQGDTAVLPQAASD